MAGDGTPTHKSGGRLRWLRWSIVALLALGLLTYVILGVWSQGAETCRDKLAANGNVVRVCEPASSTDPSILVPLLAIVLLLLPDFSEVAIPGPISLKKKVEEQGQRQDALENRIDLALTQSQNQTFNAIMANPTEIQALVAGVPEKEAALARGEPVPPRSVESADALVPEPEAAVLAQELIARWERLAEAQQRAATFLGRPDPTGVRASSAPVSPTTAALMLWAQVFAEELEYVGAARNSVAHGRSIDDETLRQAVELARELEDALQRTIRP